jgi:hypothetical protein
VRARNEDTGKHMDAITSLKREISAYNIDDYDEWSKIFVNLKHTTRRQISGDIILLRAS